MAYPILMRKARGRLVMIDIKIEDGNVVISFPKEFLSIDYFSNIVKALEIEKIVSKSKLTEEKASEMSEKLKRKWWEENRDSFIARQ